MAGDAEDKTEAPSAKRLQQARDEGRTPLSREVAGLSVLVVGAWLIASHLPDAARTATRTLSALLYEAHRQQPATAMRSAAMAWFGLIWPFALATLLASAAGVMLQTGFLVRIAAVRPNFGKLNPLAGLGRVFGPHNLMEAAKSLAKVALVGAVGWNALQQAWPDLARSVAWSPQMLTGRIHAQLMGVVTAMLATQGVIAAVDVIRTRISFNASQRMTRQEQRDEQRESEGDPHVKGRIRQIRMQRAKRRMMQAVPQATVVVTNPTHYAVALAYDRAANGAPRVVAKGMDEMAARIREAARKAGVPLVANPPLARALFPLPLDAEVPAEQFKAVAELIAYVWRLKAVAR